MKTKANNGLPNDALEAGPSKNLPEKSGGHAPAGKQAAPVAPAAPAAPAAPVAPHARLFSSRAIWALIIPLVIERFLDMAVGMADTVMVSSVGEAAVSGVALVDAINNLVLFVLAALATGGAVVVSQYLGREEPQNARAAAKQLLYTTLAASLLLTALMLGLRDQILRMIFGSIKQDVMQHAQAYCSIIAISYPFVALSNSVAALYRSMGNSKITMLVSLMMNAINIGGNAFFIYGQGMGPEGAALASLISRVVAAVVFLVLVHNPRNVVFVSNILHFEFRPEMVKNILRIGVPNGLENGVFHIGKLAVQRLVTTFGTASIAANAAAGQITSLAFVPGAAISLAIITVIGQCMGAGEEKQAVYYTKYLMTTIVAIQSVLCLLMFIFGPSMMHIFNLSEEATQLGVRALRLMAPMLALIWPFAFPFANVLRAAGDARFTMIVSIITMWIFRVGMSYVIAHFFHAGMLSVYYAMILDWIVRAACFLLRFRSGKWKEMHVI